MRGRKLWMGVAGLALMLLFGRVVIAQDGGDFKPTPPAPEMKVLQGLVGTWDSQVKFYLDPSKPPQESKGLMQRKMIMDGRFLEEKYEGKVFGSTFKGYGLAGYDTGKKLYSSLWIDSMSNNMMVGYGTYDAKTKTFTHTSEDIDPYSKKKVKNRSVLRVVSDQEQLFEMFATPEGGKEFKQMEIKYTRQGKP